MPEMDGIEATKLIKKSNPTLPIIMLTAYALKPEEDKIRESGCDDYITKPISYDSLLNVLQNFIS